jgi:hypothetical protein
MTALTAADPAISPLAFELTVAVTAPSPVVPPNVLNIFGTVVEPAIVAAAPMPVNAAEARIRENPTVCHPLLPFW